MYGIEARSINYNLSYKNVCFSFNFKSNVAEIV